MNIQRKIKKTKTLQNEDSKLKNKLENKVSELKENQPIVEKTKDQLHQNVEETSEVKEKHEQSQNDSSLQEEKIEENLVSKSSLPVEKTESEETLKCTFRSKRLQQRQEEKQKLQDTLKPEKSESDKDEEGSIQGESEEELEEETSEESETSSDESEADEGVSGDDWNPNSWTSTGLEKSKKSVPKKERSEKIEGDDVSHSSDDEESNKPLALIKKELKESPKKKVVTKVIKVVKKIRLKNGKIKKKLIKVIKRVRTVDEDRCPKIPGMRRTRCKKCSGCRVKDDCGECVFCK